MKNVKVSLYGGLGNQLFQYAAGFALAKRLNVPLVLDLSWFEEVKSKEEITTRKFALAPFDLDVTATILDTHSFFSLFKSKLLQRLNLTNGKSDTYHEKSFHFDSDFLKISCPVHLNGYWQSYKYFDNVADELRQSIGQPKKLNVGNQAILDQISAVDAICLHVRRGDYVSNANAAGTHGLCNIDYYKKGLQALTENVAQPHCFIFSDDPEWVKNNMELNCSSTIVDINGPDDVHYDLWLMASCKHFVIANSTLSWWAAWLGCFTEKIVVAPKQWFLTGDKSTDDLIPDTWIRF